MSSSSSLILAYDVTGSQDSMALSVYGESSSSIQSMNFYHSSPRGNSQRQSSRLLPDLQEFLYREGYTFRDIQVLCTLVGPGSFTGIRIGLATAQGMTLAHPCPLFAPSTLELLLYIGAKMRSSPDIPLTAVIDSGRGDYFALRTSHNNSQEEAVILSKEEVFQRYDCQENIVSLAPIPDLNCFLPQHPLSHHLIEFYEECPPEIRERRKSPTPFYLRNPEFKEKTSCLPLLS